MGQRLRKKENEFVPNLKPTKPLVSLGQCCSWVVSNYKVKQIKGCSVRAETIYRYSKTIS